MWNIGFVINAVALGIGLAMDAFSVSMANGLHEPDMKKAKVFFIAFTFGFFQFLMPMIGWTCVHTITEHFRTFQKFVPWIALLLLGYIGGKMILEGLHEDGEADSLGSGTLLVQGIATSIDALSVGFTISEYTFLQAFSASLIIMIVTFIICIAGVGIGKKFGMKLAGKSSIFGGIILICIGLEILIKSFL